MLDKGSDTCRTQDFCADYPRVPDLYKRVVPKPKDRDGGSGDSSQTGDNQQYGGDQGGSQTPSQQQEEPTRQDDPGTVVQPQEGVPANQNGPIVVPGQRPAEPFPQFTPEWLAWKQESNYFNPDAGFSEANRVPGVDKLPLETPAHKGLEQGSALRASYERFRNWDIQGSDIIPPESHYLFFTGQKVRREPRREFQRVFNDISNAQFREGLDPDDTGKIFYAADLYKGLDNNQLQVPEEKKIVPAGSTLSEAAMIDSWVGQLASYGLAKRAAQKGGIVRIIADGNGATPSQVDGNALFQEGSYWWNFEAETLTNSDSRVTKILAYNVDDFNMAPKEVWAQGQPSIGKTPDWAEGTLPREKRPVANVPAGFDD